MKKCSYLVIAGILFSQPLLVSATEINESNTQASVEITEEQEENSIPTVTSEKENNSVATSQHEETEQTHMLEKELLVTKEENKPEQTNSTEEANEQGTKSGSVQTDDYDWNEETGTLTVKKGEFQQAYPAVNSLDVEKIILNEGVTFPNRSYRLFTNYRNVKNIEELEKIDTSNVVYMTFMFSEMEKLTSLDLSNFNTSNVVDMYGMFSGMSSLSNLNVSSFDTSNVIDMGSMFARMSSLTSLDVSSFDTSNVVNMSYMFFGLSALTSLDLSSFDTSNVIDMGSMFDSSINLSSLNITQFNTINVEHMNFMFYGLNNIKSLDVSHFDTFNVTNMQAMFADMSGLNNLNISNFDTSNVVDMYGMFSGSYYLSSIVLGNRTKLNNTTNFVTLKEGPEYTGNWSYIKDANGNKPSNPLSLSDDELMNYDGTYPGTYVWEKKQGQPVTIQYVDKDGKNLAETAELTGPLGEPYEAQAKEIEGYLLDKEQLPENRKGTFTDQKQTVTFIYKKAPVKAGDVTVRYEDEKGNELSKAIVMSGNVGDTYSSEQKEFPDYTLKEVKGAASGTFGINPQQVVYVYQKEASSTDQSTTSNDKKPTDSTTPSEKGAASNGHEPKESGNVPLTHSPKDPSTNVSEQDDTEEGRKNRKLPQTNEQANLFLATIGFSLLVLIFISSIWYKKYRVLKNK